MNKKKIEVFLEFLIFGVIMGIVEDLIAVKFATNETITWSIILIITLVAIPFAAVGELIVDRIQIFPKKRSEVFLEFLIFGVIMGIVEDLIAVKFATSEPITYSVVLIVALVTIPFAAIGELIVDRVHILPKKLL
jgi:putative Mn2+ efflux pump MntP